MVDSFKNTTIWNGMLLIHSLSMELQLHGLSNEMHKSLCASIAPCSVHGIMLLACGNVHWLNDILSCAGKHILQHYAMRMMKSAMTKNVLLQGWTLAPGAQLFFFSTANWIEEKKSFKCIFNLLRWLVIPWLFNRWMHGFEHYVGFNSFKLFRF